MNTSFRLRSFPLLTLFVVFGCLFNPALQSKLDAQGMDHLKAREATESKSDVQAKAESNEKLKTAIGWREIEIQLEPMVPIKVNRGVGCDFYCTTFTMSE